jgi:NAD(P)-dependent dehydrogenase (short-subunit alcohol dehydrogenase family)
MAATLEPVGDLALVTGAARGIGRAVVRALADAGVTVLSADVADHDPGPGAEAVLLDVADRAAVDRTVAEAPRPISILVNNAGIYAARDGLEIDDADWQRTFDVIVGGTFYCSRAVTRRLLAERRPGAIVNISSIAGKRAFPGQADYCAAKAAVLGFTRAAALDLATKDITVNAICPGTVATPMIERVISEMAAAEGRTEDELRSRIVGQVPIARMQTPEEIAAGVLFLASTAARAITGETLIIDGGQTRD